MVLDSIVLTCWDHSLARDALPLLLPQPPPHPLQTTMSTIILMMKNRPTTHEIQDHQYPGQEVPANLLLNLILLRLLQKLLPLLPLQQVPPLLPLLQLLSLLLLLNLLLRQDHRHLDRTDHPLPNTILSADRILDHTPTDPDPIQQTLLHQKLPHLTEKALEDLRIDFLTVMFVLRRHQRWLKKRRIRMEEWSWIHRRSLKTSGRTSLGRIWIMDRTILIRMSCIV